MDKAYQKCRAPTIRQAGYSGRLFVALGKKFDWKDKQFFKSGLHLIHVEELGHLTNALLYDTPE